MRQECFELEQKGVGKGVFRSGFVDTLFGFLCFPFLCFPLKLRMFYRFKVQVFLLSFDWRGKVLAYVCWSATEPAVFEFDVFPERARISFTHVLIKGCHRLINF